MYKNYFVIAVRNLLRNKMYSLINILGLSIGLACTMLIILYVKDEVSFDRFHNNVDHIYRIVSSNKNKETGESHKDGNTGFFQGPRFAANVPGIEKFVRIQSNRMDLKKDGEVSSLDPLMVDSTFFQVFTFPLLYGNPNTCLKDPYAIVLSEKVALKEFGTTNAVGKTLEIKIDSVFRPYTVTAVAKNTPQNSSIQFDYLLPFRMDPSEEQNAENWFNFFLNTFVVLSPNANRQKVESSMHSFYDLDSKEAVKVVTERFGPINWQSNYDLQPYTDMHLNDQLPAQNGLSNASNPTYSYILSGIAIFILLIACINFVNLTIARSIRRAKEIGIRKVIGSEKRQLVFQFLGESVLLTFFAFVLAIFIVLLVLPVFNDLANKALSLSYLFDFKLVAGYIVLFLATAFLAGIYPALVLSSYKPVDTLYSRFNIGGKNYLQRALVVLQFSLASFLIIATFTLYRQFNFLTNEKLGYDDKNLVKIDKSMLSREEVTLWKAELMRNPNIAGVAAKNNGNWSTTARLQNDSAINFAYETIDENYLPLLKINIRQGRNFSTAFPSDSSNSILVNQSFVKKAGWKNPLGQQVNFWYDNNKRYTVIGVVDDYHFASLNEEIKPQMFTMKKANFYGTTFIKLKDGSITESLNYIKATFKKMFPLSPYNYSFEDDNNRKQYEAEAKWKQIMLFSAILTIFISCIGLFGLSVLSAEKRTKEIGIRKVLGASVNSVVTTLSKDFLKLVVIALVIACPLAWMAADKWLQHYPYRVTLGWSMFTAAGLLVILIALITVSFQAVKAAVANPTKSLRSE